MPWSAANRTWWKQYYNDNKEYRKALNRDWRARNKDKVRAAAKRHDAKPETKEWKREWAKKNRERTNFKRRARISEIRGKVIDGYGGKCVCCGESQIIFLAIDHVNNDGAQERKVKGVGWKYYADIIRNGFPAKYQVLCYNCNWAKYRGGCPHQTGREA